jgi:hypothetical protein
MTSIIKVDTVQDIDGNNIISENANTITIGASGDTISIPAGATLVNSGTATGFGLTWQSVQTTGFTAVKGNAYPCDTTSAAFTVTLPATPSAGDQVQLVDYAGTFDTNNLTISPNGNKIEGGTASLQLKGEREGVILTYIDSTQGWIATSGINEGTDALEPITYTASYLIVAGGGGGGYGVGQGGGGGAGGYLTSTTTLSQGTVYTITVGSGGTGGTSANNLPAGSGSNSVFSSFTATGGGGGGNQVSGGASGGSGGGGSSSGPSQAGGSGTVGQGNAGGSGNNTGGTGGGGGASAVGANGSGAQGGAGGNGTASSITGSSITYAGGGGGGTYIGSAASGGSGGGGVGALEATSDGVAGTTNLGGGGGGGAASFNNGKNGGSGVVILSVPTANYSNTTTGSPTVTTSGSNTIIKFTGSGSYTA